MTGKREFDQVSVIDPFDNEIPDELKAPIRAFKARVVDDTSSTLTPLELVQLGYKTKKNIQSNLRKLNPRNGINHKGERDDCIELVTALMGKYPKIQIL